MHFIANSNRVLIFVRYPIALFLIPSHFPRVKVSIIDQGYVYKGLQTAHKHSLKAPNAQTTTHPRASVEINTLKAQNAKHPMVSINTFAAASSTIICAHQAKLALLAGDPKRSTEFKFSPADEIKIPKCAKTRSQACAFKTKRQRIKRGQSTLFR